MLTSAMMKTRLLKKTTMTEMNPKYCDIVKNHIASWMIEYGIYDEDRTIIDVSIGYDITDVHSMFKLLIIIDEIPLPAIIILKEEAYSWSPMIYKITKKLEKRFQEVIS